MSEHDILADPAASRWLKEQIRATQSRDVVDAIADAKVLLSILNNRFAETLALAKRVGTNQQEQGDEHARLGAD